MFIIFNKCQLLLLSTWSSIATIVSTSHTGSAGSAPIIGPRAQSKLITDPCTINAQYGSFPIDWLPPLNHDAIMMLLSCFYCSQYSTGELKSITMETSHDTILHYAYNKPFTPMSSLSSIVVHLTLSRRQFESNDGCHRRRISTHGEIRPILSRYERVFRRTK